MASTGQPAARPGAYQSGRIARPAGDLGLVLHAGERAKAVSLFREALRALREADDPGAASLVHYHLAFELIQDDEVSEALQHAV